mmetsp:Transcript_31654/g.41838  ORF Transcript_31654/g.41838 Transcript_31654/m.41838 type:complete len:218 (-) Transcript_31654:1414-2067(-)
MKRKSSKGNNMKEWLSMATLTLVLFSRELMAEGKKADINGPPAQSALPLLLPPTLLVSIILGTADKTSAPLANSRILQPPQRRSSNTLPSDSPPTTPPSSGDPPAQLRPSRGGCKSPRPWRVTTPPHSDAHTPQPCPSPRQCIPSSTLHGAPPRPPTTPTVPHIPWLPCPVIYGTGSAGGGTPPPENARSSPQLIQIGPGTAGSPSPPRNASHAATR